jgi:UDP-N-acetylglucosamine 2-epimerase
MYKLLMCYGTRPEWIKIKPLLYELKSKGMKCDTLFTGQHQNIAPKDSTWAFDEMKPLTNNRLDNIVTNILHSVDHILDQYTHILIQGDTTSVMSLAIAAYHRKLKIIHLEAGLRTYDLDNPYPEEFNRSIVSKIASYHLCPTETNKSNLYREGIIENVYVVGNTVLDNFDKTGITYGNKIIVTLHRRENHHNLDKWFQEISKCAAYNKDLDFILPLHPNPNVQKHRSHLEGINVVDPIPYDDFRNLLKESRLIISDSGGIQEEAAFLNKKVIVCRKVTERPESLWKHGFLCESPVSLFQMFQHLIEDPVANSPCPYGAGDSSEKIANILEGIFHA